jgi:acyl-CoA synthetase (AMP-forming)/AMP-acid ligase II
LNEATCDRPGDSLVDRLEVAAGAGGGRVVFHLEGSVETIDAAQVYDAARVRAARLRRAGVGRGDRVGIIGPNRPDWLAWAHATWMRGATIVPLPIPLRIRDRVGLTRQIGALAAGFGCRLIAAHERFVPLITDCAVISWDDAGSLHDALAPEELVRANDDTPARITPTSGSTATPKGVSRSYKDQSARELTSYVPASGPPSARYLTYGPLAFFEPRLEVHMLVTERFARDPGDLFRIVGPHAISGFSGTSSAIGAAVRSIERRPDGVDLSSLTSLRFGYEMIDARVVEQLIEVGGRYGLDPLAVGAFYGLAEGGTTRTAPGQGIRIDEVDLDTLVTHGVARPATDAGMTKRIVSCGRATKRELRIAGPEGEVAERHVGEVQFRGQRLMQGYVGPGSHDAFVDGGWMGTGDLGYLADGELFITGRSKEVLVQQGKKYHPEDIEWAAARGAEVAPDQCVAFVAHDAREGEITVAVETDRTEGLDDLTQRVRAAVMNTVGISLRSVLFVAPQSLPKASSGKSQRIAASERHAAGLLG